MPLNKQKGNMYGFVTDTWNPLGGQCSHNCKYCSTIKLKKRHTVVKNKYTGPSYLVEKELKTNLGSNNVIFVCSQHDLFSEDIDSNWIIKILKHCKNFNKNTYIFQSKNPKRIKYFIWKHNEIFPTQSIIGTTIESNIHYVNFSNTPNILSRMFAIKEISKHYKTFITIEPIMDFDITDLLDCIDFCKPFKVIIGGNTSNKKLPEPNKDKIQHLLSSLKVRGHKIYIKNNLQRLLK